MSAALALPPEPSRSLGRGPRLASGKFSLTTELASAVLDGQAANDVEETRVVACRLASESCHWTSKDASRFGGGLNFFEYANNDPINYLDPSGHAAAVAGAIALGAGGGIAGGAVLAGGFVTAGAAFIGIAVWDILHQIDDFEHPTVGYYHEDLSEKEEEQQKEAERCRNVETDCAEECAPLMGENPRAPRKAPRARNCRGKGRPGGGTGLQSEFLKCRAECIERHGC